MMDTCFPWEMLILVSVLMIIVILFMNNRANQYNDEELNDTSSHRVVPIDMDIQNDNTFTKKQNESIQDAFTRCESIYGVGNCSLYK